MAHFKKLSNLSNSFSSVEFTLILLLLTINDIELVIRTILIIYVIDLQPDYRLLFINKDLGVNYMSVYKQFVSEHFSEIRTNEQVPKNKNI